MEASMSVGRFVRINLCGGFPALWEVTEMLRAKMSAVM